MKELQSAVYSIKVLICDIYTGASTEFSSVFVLQEDAIVHLLSLFSNLAVISLLA